MLFDAKKINACIGKGQYRQLFGMHKNSNEKRTACIVLVHLCAHIILQRVKRVLLHTFYKRESISDTNILFIIVVCTDIYPHSVDFVCATSRVCVCVWMVVMWMKYAQTIQLFKRLIQYTEEPSKIHNNFGGNFLTVFYFIFSTSKLKMLYN